jgi:hypothetical protein
MTELLQQAIAQIQQLPPDRQDAIASRFLAESSDNRFTLSVSTLTTVFSAYWNLTIFTSIGLAHMMSMMNCLIGCRRLDRWRSLPEVIAIDERLYTLSK